MKQNKHKSNYGLSQIDFSDMSLMQLLQFGSGALLKDAIAQEITEFLGRDYYQHSKTGNNLKKGERNGFQKTRLDTPLGQIIYERPKLAYAPGFKSKYHVPYMRRPNEFASSIADMYVNGVSTRKVKDSLKAVTGKKIQLSKSTVSRLTKKLTNEFNEWKSRDLSGFKVAYLFLDAIRVGMRLGGKNKDCVFVAYAILEDGSCETLSIGLGRSESKRSWGIFVNDLKQRSLSDPRLAISDGNIGLIEAIETYFPTSYRQRCLKHRTENILEAVPREAHDEVHKKLKRVFYGATSFEQAKLAFKEFKKEYAKKYPTAITRLETDIEQCFTFYLFPYAHWRRIRTSNKLERVNRELKRRLKVIGRHPSEEGCLALIYHVAAKYATQQIGITADELVINLWDKLRTEKEQMQKQLTLDLYPLCG